MRWDRETLDTALRKAKSEAVTLTVETEEGAKQLYWALVRRRRRAPDTRGIRLRVDGHSVRLSPPTPAEPITVGPSAPSTP